MSFATSQRGPAPVGKPALDDEAEEVDEDAEALLDGERDENAEDEDEEEYDELPDYLPPVEPLLHDDPQIQEAWEEYAPTMDQRQKAEEDPVSREVRLQTEEEDYNEFNEIMADMERTIIPVTEHMAMVVGDIYEFTPLELQKCFPDGIPGRIKYQMRLFQHPAFLIRPQVSEVVDELGARMLNRFDAKSTKNGARGNRSIIIEGDAGCGKSVVLSSVVYWARMTGWLVVFINGSEWLSTGNLQRSRLQPDCFDQPELAQQFAETMLAAHEEQLANIKLKTSFTLPGFSRTASSNMQELLEFAKDSFVYACDAIGHFRRELNLVSEYPVLIAIDDVNQFSAEKSLAFLDPDHKGLRPPHLDGDKMMMVRYFNDIANHGLLHGAVVGATSVTRPKTRRYFDQRYPADSRTLRVTVPPYSELEFQTAMQYYREMGLFPTQTRATRRFIYHVSAGRPNDVFQYCLKI
jgi:small subunit ribosomal protein S29